MARIRSIHPGLWTDEDFVTLSDAAKVFYLGLLTEADDYGAFEWKPVTLKMRLLPASTTTVEPLLAELAAANKVASYEHGGRQYGAIRNFCRYQRPKKPNSVHFMPPEFRTYVGSSDASSEPDDDEEAPVPQKAEIAPQMEDGGWRMEDGGLPEIKNSDDGDSPPRKARKPRTYAFEAKTIRLAEADFQRWQASFPHLSLRAELESLDAWATEQGKNWFQAVAGALAKRERQIVASSVKVREQPGVQTAWDPRL